MKLFKYGLVLKRIGPEDIELVREKRNSQHIREAMYYRDYITEEEQKAWFIRINNINNFYYLIIYRDEAIGLFNEKNINWEERTSETGLFIWDERYLDTHIPLMASLMLSEMGFYVFGGKASYVSVLRDNHKALSYIRSFGYVRCEGQEENELQRFVLTREAFEAGGSRLLRAMERLYPSEKVLAMLLEPKDYENGTGQALEDAFGRSVLKVRRAEDERGKWFYYP